MNLAPKNAPWFEHLTDSVRALGEAAHEWQLAEQAATVLRAGVDVHRRALHEGTVTHQPSKNSQWPRAPYSREPHTHALFDLDKAYLNHYHHVHQQYEDAALLFASGVAWAIAQVQAGQTPPAVAFTVDRDHRPVPHGYKIDLAGPHRYSEEKRLTAAYEQLLGMEVARDVAEDLAGQEHIADHEAYEMFEAAEYAEGTANAAYRYGLLAEGALQFALLDAKQQHSKQRKTTAEAVEAEETAAGEDGGAR